MVAWSNSVDLLSLWTRDFIFIYAPNCSGVDAEVEKIDFFIKVSLDVDPGHFAGLDGPNFVSDALEVLGTDLVHEGIGVQFDFLVLNMSKMLLGMFIEPVLLLFSLWELPLYYFVHRMFKTIQRSEPIKALMTAVVLKSWVAVVSHGWFLVIEVRMSVDDLTALVAPLWILPSEVLKSG